MTKIKLPITVGGYSVFIDPNTYNKTYESDLPLFPNMEPSKVQKALLAIYVAEWMKQDMLERQIKQDNEDNLMKAAPEGYVTQPSNIKRDMTISKPYGPNRGYTVYKGTFSKKDGTPIYKEDMPYIKSFRTPGQSYSLEYVDGVIKVSGYCDSTD